MNRERQPPGNSYFLLPTKESSKENCRCFDAADPRLRGCTPLRTPIRKSEGAGAKRKQYYFSFLTPPPLPPPLSRVLRGCERGATVERSETGERAMFAPAGQTTARACLRSKLAALVVRRQAPPNPRRGRGRPPCQRGLSPVGDWGIPTGLASPSIPGQPPPTAKGEGCRPPLPLSSATHLWHPVGAGHARPSTLPLPPMYLLPLWPALQPPAPPDLKHKKIAPIRLRLRMGAWGIGLCEEESCSRITVAAP